MPKNVILIRNFNTMGWEIGDFSSHERKGGKEPVMALKGPRSATLSGQQPLRWSQHWHIVRNFYNRKFTLHPPVFYVLTVTSCFCSTQPGAQHLPLSPQRMQNGHTTLSLTEKPTQISFVAATWSRWHTEMGWYSTKLSVYPFWITSWPLVTWHHLKPTNRVSPFGKVQYWKIKYQADTCEVTVVFSLRKP